MGDHFILTGAGDGVVYDESGIPTLFIQGALAFRGVAASAENPHATGVNTPILQGQLTADPATGTALPDFGATYLIDMIAGFVPDESLWINEIDIPAGKVSGSANLAVAPQNHLPFLVATQFEMTPGPSFTGLLDAIDIGIAGVTIHAGADGVLSDDGMHWATANLELPAHLGGGTGEVPDFRISNGVNLSINGGSAFSIPDIVYGSGSVLSYRHCSAYMVLLPASDGLVPAVANHLVVNATLSVDLYGQHSESNAQLQLVSSIDGTTSTLGGGANKIDLEVGAATLRLNPHASNSGISGMAKCGCRPRWAARREPCRMCASAPAAWTLLEASICLFRPSCSSTAHSSRPTPC